MKHVKFSIALALPLLVAALALSGCTASTTVDSPGQGTATVTPAATPQAVSAGTTALTISGAVNQPLQLTLADLATYATDLAGDLNRTRDDNGTLPGYAPDVTAPGNLTGMPDGSGAPAMPGNTTGMAPGNWTGQPSGGFGNGTPAPADATRGVSSYSLNSLLNEADPIGGATTAAFSGSGGTISTVLLTDIRASSGAVITRQPDGSLQATIPGLAEEKTISGLTAIEIS